MLSTCRFLFLVIALTPICGQSLLAESPATWTETNLPQLTEIYHHLHQHPELSFQEKETAAYLAEKLKAAGADVTQNVGGHGVVAIMKNGEGPTVMLRTDLDALPVEEKTNLVYASKVKVENSDGTMVGVMHACGHDVHITNLIGVAQYMSQHKSDWKGTLMMIGQPAEERGAGARAMLADGLFEKFPKPDFAIALHVDSTLAAGHVALRPGYMLANVDSVDVTMFGKGGHGAAPHTTVDPIVQAALLVVDLQTIVSREIKPTDPAVITVGSIHGGTKHNIIGDDCHLQITVRSYSDEVRQHLTEAIQRKAKAVALGARAPEPKVEFSEGSPALFNDAELAGRLGSVLKQVFGKERVHEAEPVMGGEDFSQYGRVGVPILMYRLGAVNEDRLNRYKELGQSSPSLHSPLFYPDFEETITTGITTMSVAALELLK